jgi:hypothetical protein
MLPKITNQLVVFTGIAQSGKTTCANRLESFGWKRVSFADPLKYMLSDLGVPGGCLWGDRKEEPLEILGGKSARYAMQTLGTEWGRDLIWGEIWLSAWERKVRSILSRGGRVVNDDIRFPNEFELIRKMGGTIVKVERPGVSTEHTHSSESHYDNLNEDLLIKNGGTVEALKASLAFHFGL